MDANKEYVSNKKEYQMVIEDQNHCCLCGEKLIFKHKFDYMILRVQEEAHCPACKIRLKVSDHGLH